MCRFDVSSAASTFMTCQNYLARQRYKMAAPTMPVMRTARGIRTRVATRSAVRRMFVTDNTHLVTHADHERWMWNRKHCYFEHTTSPPPNDVPDI